MMRIDIYHHVERDSQVQVLLQSIMDLLKEKVMPLIDDLQTKADQTLAKAQANSDVDDSILTIVSGQSQQIRDLKAALDAAGTDPAKLQALSDTMDRMATIIDNDKQKVADAVTANTPAA